MTYFSAGWVYFFVLYVSIQGSSNFKVHANYMGTSLKMQFLIELVSGGASGLLFTTSSQ